MTAARPDAPWRLALATMFLFIPVGPAHSDDAAGEQGEALVMEVMVVTGSRIPRPDFESASPVVTIDADAFAQSIAFTVEAVLNRYPQLVPNASSGSNNPSQDGQSFLDLRGLGPQATLVLLDGRRMTPSNGLGVVDVNLIPPTLIERVEIVSGGASAVYGSDAVAGVVNFRLHEHFEGFNVGGSYGQTARGDGEQWDAHFTAGTLFAGGRGSVYGFAGRSERHIVTYGDRDYARYALNYVGLGNGLMGPGDSFVPGGSGFIEEGSAFLPQAGPNPVSGDAFGALFNGYGFPPGTVPPQPGLGFNLDGSLFTLGNFTPGSVANFRDARDPVLFNDRAYRYNFAPPNALQLPLERTSLFGRLSFDLTGDHRFYAEALHGDYEARQQLAPAPVFAVFMPRGNPFIPPDLAVLLDSRPNPQVPFFWSKRMGELGPRVASNDYQVTQGTFGVDGYLAREWRYDVYVQHGRNRHDQLQTANALRSRIEALTFAADGGLAACGGFDVFGRGSISADCAHYIAADGTNRARSERTLAEASLQGPALALPAGDLQVAAGVYYKRDTFSYAADPIASAFLPDGRSDIVGFNASDDVFGSERNLDLYSEFLVPLLADTPGAVALDAGLGYRHTRYREAGNADALKAELLYRPIATLRLRGSYQNAVRAPSVTELFRPRLPSFFSLEGPFVDPCEVGSPQRTGPDAAAVEALCLAQGIPADLLPDWTAPNFGGYGFSGGNPDLSPEKADTLTLGLAWSPRDHDPRLGRLQVAIDWYRVAVRGAIRTVPGPRIIEFCFSPEVNPDFAPDNPWCSLFSRDPQIGEIVDLYEIDRNIGRIETAGVDLQTDWRREVGPGTLGLNWLISWVDYFRRVAGPGAPTEELSGTTAFFLGTTLPRWKALLALDYSWGGTTVTARTRYAHSMSGLNFPEFRVPSRTYLDLHLDHDFSAARLAGLRLAVGIENLTDRDPPLFPSSFGVGFDPQQHDTLGRRFYLSLNYRF